MPTFNLFFILSIVRKYSRYILSVVLLATALSIIFTLPYFYPPQFSSKTIIYPSNSERYDLGNLLLGESQVYLYGTSKEAEKLANFAQSETAAFFVIDSLHLWDTYGINPKSDAYPKFKVLREFRGNLSVTQSEGAGITIEAFDSDPARAASIVNLLVYKINHMNQEMVNKNRKQIIELYQKNYTSLMDKYEKALDSARMIRKTYNIFSYQEQTKVLLEQLLKTQYKVEEYKGVVSALEKGGNAAKLIEARGKLKGAEANMRSLTGGALSLDKFREGIDRLISAEQQSFQILSRLQNIREKLIALENTQELNYDSALTLEQATPSDKKARPVRWVIVIASFLISLVATIGCLILIEFGLPYLRNRSESPK